MPTGWVGPRDLEELGPEKTGLRFLNSHLGLGAQRAPGCGRARLPGQEGLGRSRMPTAGSRTPFPHHHLSTARAGSALSTAQGPARRLPMRIEGGGGQGVCWNPSDDLAPPSVGAAAGPGGGCPQQSPSHGPCCSHAPPRRALRAGAGWRDPRRCHTVPSPMAAQTEAAPGRSRSREPPRPLTELKRRQRTKPALSRRSRTGRPEQRKRC